MTSIFKPFYLSPHYVNHVKCYKASACYTASFLRKLSVYRLTITHFWRATDNWTIKLKRRKDKLKKLNSWINYFMPVVFLPNTQKSGVFTFFGFLFCFCCCLFALTQVFNKTLKKLKLKQHTVTMRHLLVINCTVIIYNWSL